MGSFVKEITYSSADICSPLKVPCRINAAAIKRMRAVAHGVRTKCRAASRARLSWKPISNADQIAAALNALSIGSKSILLSSCFSTAILLTKPPALHAL
jgi:hypothetical protein